MRQLTAAIVGSGNIASDLLIKLNRSSWVKPTVMVGVDPDSAGLHRASRLGLATSHLGVDWLLDQDVLPDLVLEATSAAAHEANAPRYREAGIRAIDLTPAAVGEMVCPAVGITGVDNLANINMITCGGQATIPIVAAVSRVADVAYAEIVASIASRSAGPGTRANIDEFTTTTAKAIRTIGGARTAKAIIVLNPVEPPMIMRDTVFCGIPADADRVAIAASIHEMVRTVQKYVSGYELRAEPQFDGPQDRWQGMARVTVLLKVTGRGDFLPRWAGNLDIMTAAAVAVAEHLAAAPEMAAS